MEDRQKVLYILKKMKEERQETIKRVTSDYGTQLRMNRSIQAEGSFANIKEDMEFMGPVRLKDVEESQQKIVSTIRRLEDSGEIVIARSGEDELVT